MKRGLKEGGAYRYIGVAPEVEETSPMKRGLKGYGLRRLDLTIDG